MISSHRIAVRVLQASAVVVVLAAAPYKLFDLDRFFVAKELVLHLTAASVTLLCVWRARQFALARVDQLLALWLLLGVVSALFAANWWLAGRAVAISVAGAACFWSARALARAGYARALTSAVAVAGIVGAATALLQAYGVRTEYMSLNRAPGGTFGNRNFMAHLCVITLPALLITSLRATSPSSRARWHGGLVLVGGALILSRSRAAWLGLLVGTVVLVVAAFLALRRQEDSPHRTRLSPALLALVAVLGGGAGALVLPNALDWKSDSPYLDTANSIVDYKGGSGHGRLIQYGNSLRMSLRHPLLGVGPGNWPVDYPRYASINDPSLGPDGMTANPWPSSDWITFVSERGAAALALLALAVLALGIDAVRALRHSPSTDDRLTAATLLGTLATLLVVSSFDAVLLLPVAALVAWTALGALSLPSRVRRVIVLTRARRVMAMAGVAVMAGVAIWRSGSQLSAMSVANSSARLTVLEHAAAIDPGNYRIHTRLAEAHRRRGDCVRASTHARAARRLFPHAPAPRRILSGCGR